MAQQDSGLTLTKMTHFGRLTVKYGLIALVAIMVGRFSLTTFVGVWRALNPPPPPPPTVGFGLLPAIEFPEQGDADKPSRYVLETPTGTVPAFADRAKVFFMPQNTVSLLDDERVRQIASGLGFVFEPTVVNSQTYRWTSSSFYQKNLTIDTQNYTFELDSDFLSRPNLFGADVVDSKSAISLVKRQLSTVNLLEPDVATDSGEVSFLKVLGSDFVPAVSVSDADVLRVDLGRPPVDGLYEVYTPRGKTGNVIGYVASSEVGVFKLENFQYTVDYTQVHTYPLRTSQEAWQVLQAGEGYIASGNELESAVIRRVYLGYYDSFLPQEYFQPIYVFEGDDDFIGYVPAVSSQYVGIDQSSL